MSEGEDERPTWQPTGLTPLGAPRPKPTVDHRWRPFQAPTQSRGTREEKTVVAITQQCLNSRVPGYTGFIPSNRAEDLIARSQAALGHTAVREQARRREMRASDSAARADGVLRSSSRGSTPGAGTPSSSVCGATLRPENIRSATEQAANTRQVTRFGLPAGCEPPDDHPLGKSKSLMVRSHWVPTIPGYSGYIPSKHSENIVGGGMTDTCRMAGRAIAERGGPGPAERRNVTIHDDGVQRSRIAEHFHGASEDGEERLRLSKHIRDHCDKQIPGYQGHIPKIFGESIYGSTSRAANLIAASIAEDRIHNSDDSHTVCARTQAPAPKQLRF